MSFSLTSEIKKRSDEIAKQNASTIDPKNGTSVSLLQFHVIAGREYIERKQKEADEKINANTALYSENVARELNAPIIAELNDGIRVIKDNVRSHVNSMIDERIKRIQETKNLPVRSDRMPMIQTIKMLVDMDADIAPSDWKDWGELFAGHYLEEKVFASLAKQKNVTILPAFDPVKSIENLEAFRKMANTTIDNLDKAEESLSALSFLKVSSSSPLGKLMQEIDSDVASIIPADRLSLLKRLKEAKQNAFDKDDISLSAKIGSFIDKNIEKLATEELNDSLNVQAEELIKLGLTAKKQ